MTFLFFLIHYPASVWIIIIPTHFVYGLVSSAIRASSAAGVSQYHLVVVRSYSGPWLQQDSPVAAFVRVDGPAIHRNTI